MRYDAFGNTRYTQGETLTDYQYTGQRFESGIGLYYYNARWYDPALGRFAQADTVIPPGVQGYDRYVYVNNNPLNATDPTGHTSCSDIPNEQARQYCLNQGGLPGFGDDSGYVNNGNDVNNENDGGGGTLTPTPTPTTNLPPTPKPIVDSPNSSPAPLPSTITFHPLDGNVVSQVPIYDYSWFPPKLIGYRITSYGIDAVHFNPMDFIFPSDALTFTSVIHSYILTPLMEGGIQNLASVGIDVSCPVCGGVLTLAASLDSLNNAITFDGHLRVYDQYFSEPPFGFEIPFMDPFHIPISK